MKKMIKSFLVLALAGTMTFGTGLNAYAADTATDTDSNFTISGDTVSSDTSSINLIKNYIRGTGTQTDSVSPEETFVFTITPYAVWNAGTVDGTENGASYSADNMPLLGTTNGSVVVVDDTNRNTTVRISANVNDAGKSKPANLSKAITIPEYHSVGDFWYQVVETNNKTTGVSYATNDEATIDETYFIHVQVLNGTTKGTFLRSVTLHKTAPNSGISTTEYNQKTFDSSEKVNNIQNTYSAGTLDIKKEVTGNAGDKDKRFGVTVTFKKPAGTILTSDITYSAYTIETATSQTALTISGQDDTNSIWMTNDSGTTKLSADSEDEGYAKVKVWIKHDETVTFNNIPYGVTYTVEEDNYSSLKYETPVYKFDDSSKTIDTAKDTVKITNEKNLTIDIGVILSNAPFIALLAVAGSALAVLIRRRRKTAVED